jgi:glutaredoxin
MTIRMYGTLWCSDCKRAKQLFGEQRVPYEFIDIDTNATRVSARSAPRVWPAVHSHPAPPTHLW